MAVLAKEEYKMRFCKYCGRQLGDNELCTCPDAQAEAQRNAQQPAPQSTDTPVYEEAPAQQPAPQEIQYETHEQVAPQPQEMPQQPPVQEAQPTAQQPAPAENPTPDFSENPAAVFNAPPQQL